MYSDLIKFQDGHTFDDILSLSTLNASKILFDFERSSLYFFWEAESFTGLG